MIKLYGITASRASRSLWMLEELGVPYEQVPVHILGDSKKPEYLAINPNGRIPALDDGGLVLFESIAINLHLARKYGRERGLWPASEDDQSLAIQWSVWAMTEIEPAALKVVRHRAVLPEDQRQAEVADEAEAELQKPLGVLEQALRGREYLLGGGFTVADLDVQSVLWVPVVLGKCDISAYPSTKGWLDRGRARPAYLRAMSGRR